MRSACAVVGLLAFALSVAGCASSSEGVAPNTPGAGQSARGEDHRPIEGDSATLVVRGLSCPKCANNVNLQLEKVAGVGETHIDMGTGEVRVRFDRLAMQRPSRAALAQAIADAGFTLVEIRTP
jgi:copper chaperone CopZ